MTQNTINKEHIMWLEETLHRFIQNEVWSQLQEWSDEKIVIKQKLSIDDLAELEDSLCSGVSTLFDEVYVEMDNK